MKIFIANKSDFSPNTIIEKSINNTEIIFVRHNENVLAYSGICPHQGAKLANGIIENEHIVCPLHKRTFACKNGYDIKTHTKLKSYTVIDENDKIYIDFENDNADVKNSACPHKTINDLPTPKGSLLLGNLPQFKADNKPKILENWVKDCGDIFRIRLLHKKFIVSANSDLNIALYKSRPDKFRRFGKIDEIMSEMGIKGVFNAEGDTWKNHRKITAEALNAKNVQGFFPTISDITQNLYNRWMSKTQPEYVVDVQKEMMRYTVDITSKIAFGYDTHTLQNDSDLLQKDLEKIFPMINKRITKPIPFWRIRKSVEDKELDNALQNLQKTISEFIQKAQNKLDSQPTLKQQPENFLQALLVEKEKGGVLTENEIYGNVFTLLLAGEDTTSNSISWALYYLSQNPEKYKKLVQEADSVLGTQTQITEYEQLALLKYTEAVAMETLRICPVTPTLFLESLEDQVVNGLQIKKGTTVMMQSKVGQTSDQNFSEANQFIPERWLANQTECPVHNTDAFRTFGAGPRFCPGKNLALHEMKMALSLIARNFEFELHVKPEDVIAKFGFTLFPENLILRIKKRIQ